MPDPVRDDDHDARIAALSAFEASITSNVDVGLKELGTLNDPLRMHAAIQLLIQNDRFQDAIDLVSGRSPQCKWIELIVYAHVALKDLASAKLLVDNARDYCKTSWGAERCRIAVADSAFREVLQNTLGAGVIATGGLTDDERRTLEFVVDVLNPLVAPVRLSGRVDSEIQRAAVEYAINAQWLLAQFSQIVGLIEPMLQCTPVPLLIAQLALRRICEPPKGLSGRIRVEHPGNFTALFLAALLDREVYGRIPQSLNALIGLQQLARDLGSDAIEQLCQGLFETASAMNPAALTQSRGVIDSLLGTPNRYQLYFDAVGQLMRSNPGDAIHELDSDKRDEDAVWWQIAAKAHEMIGDIPKASHCWDQACRLMPHPDMLTRFAGLSIQQRRFEDAVRALSAAVVQSPDDPRILEQLAFAHTRLRQFPQAKEVFQKLVRACPDVPRHLINLAICDVHSGDPLSALNSLDAAIEQSGNDLELLSMRTQILTSLDRANDAFTDLHRQRSEYWSNARFLVLYMDTAYRAGKENEAHAAFRVLMSMQQNGQLPQPLFRPVTLDELKEIGTKRLRQRGKLEYRDSESRRRFRDEDADNNGDIDDDREPPPYLDAVLLANDLNCRLLADDRVCQTAVLSRRPDIEDLAFGTDLLLIGFQEQGMLSVDEVSTDLINMMRWRYRFLLPEPLHLKAAAMRSRESLPGPELRQIAAYIQESMRDPGLFCGMEKSEPPTPIAFKYFMGWKELCVQFLASIWEDASIENKQLKFLTTWCLESLLPAVPRGLRHMPLGRRLGDLTPKAIMLSAMIRFATVQPVERASEALRLMSKCLGMTEDEFYDAAAEAADERYF